MVEAEHGALPLADLLPGVPGALGIGHPVACQTLFDAAVRAGAQALRGVEQVKVTAGESPAVRTCTAALSTRSDRASSSPPTDANP